MNTLTHDSLATLTKRILIGTLVLIALLMLGISVTHAGENAQSPGTAESRAVTS